MRIDIAGVGLGTPGESRNDGHDRGMAVTLNSVGGGLTHRFGLLWVPYGDTTAPATLADGGGGVWTFTAGRGFPGTYRILLVVDEGLPTESRQIRTLRTLSRAAGLAVPALNERGDPDASAENAGAEVVGATEDNAPIAGGIFAAGNWAGWHRFLRDIAKIAEAVTAMPADAPGYSFVDHLFRVSAEWNQTVIAGGTITELKGSDSDADKGAGWVQLEAKIGGDSAKLVYGKEFVRASTAPRFRARVKLGANPGDGDHVIGLARNVGISSLALFEVNPSHEWQINCVSANGTGSTTTNTGVIATAGWHDLEIRIIEPGVRCGFFVDGVQIGEITDVTAVPQGTDELAPYFFTAQVAGIGSPLTIDAVEVQGRNE